MQSFFERLPDGIALVFTLFFILSAILFLIYRLSEHFSRKRFLFFLSVLVFFLSLSVVLLFVFKKTWPDKPRVGILPFQNSSVPLVNHWISRAIADIIEKSLPQDSASSYFLFSNEDILKIARLDSISDLKYQERFASSLKLDFFLTGKIEQSDDNFAVEYKFLRTGGSENQLKSIRFKEIDKIPPVGLKIAEEFLLFLSTEKSPNRTKIDEIQIGSLETCYRARIHFFENNLDSAKLLLKQSIKLDPKNIDAWLFLGECYISESHQAMMKGNLNPQLLEEAGNCFKTAQKLDSLNVGVCQKLAKFYILKKNWSFAERQLSIAYRLNPASPTTYLYYSQLHPSRFEALGFKDEEQLLRYSLHLNPRFVEGALALSSYYVNYLQDNQKAIQAVEKMVAINPDCIDALMELGRLYIADNQTLKVIKSFERIISLDPSNSNAFYNLGIYYYNLKDFENAQKLFARAVKIDDHLDAHLYLAFIYENLTMTENDSVKRQALLDQAVGHLRYRLVNNRGKDDPYAETARKHLYEIFH